MVNSINTLLDRQQEALARERNLANEVAHELRTNIPSFCRRKLSSLAWQTDNAAMQAALQRIGQDALHAGHVLDQLLTLARAGRGMLDAPLQTVNWAARRATLRLHRPRAHGCAKTRWRWMHPSPSWCVAMHCCWISLPCAIWSKTRVLPRRRAHRSRCRLGVTHHFGQAWVQVCDDGRRDAARPCATCGQPAPGP